MRDRKVVTIHLALVQPIAGMGPGMKTHSLKRALYAAPILMLAASCASISPESRVRSALIEAGLSPRTAACMAADMSDRLSIGQLRQIQSLASLRNSHMGDMTVDRLLYKVRALEDPEIFVVTSKAAVRCLI